MNKCYLLISLLAGLIACSPNGGKTPSPPVISRASVVPGQTSASVPSRSLPDNAAKVTALRTVVQASFPVQVIAIISIHLPDTCTETDEVSEQRTDEYFNLLITTQHVEQQGVPCQPLRTVQDYEVPLSVKGLEAGLYQVEANGLTDLFELPVDNQVPAVY